MHQSLPRWFASVHLRGGGEQAEETIEDISKSRIDFASIPRIDTDFICLFGITWPSADTREFVRLSRWAIPSFSTLSSRGHQICVVNGIRKDYAFFCINRALGFQDASARTLNARTKTCYTPKHFLWLRLEGGLCCNSLLELDCRSVLKQITPGKSALTFATFWLDWHLASMCGNGWNVGGKSQTSSWAQTCAELDNCEYSCCWRKFWGDSARFFSCQIINTDSICSLLWIYANFFYSKST